jgi:hypothetical protein
MQGSDWYFALLPPNLNVTNGGGYVQNRKASWWLDACRMRKMMEERGLDINFCEGRR